MKKIAFLLCLTFLGLSTTFAQKTLFGTVTYTISMEGEGAEAISGMMPEKMIFLYSKKGVIMEMKGGMLAQMMGKTVVNEETGETWMVKDSEKAYYLLSEEDIQSQAANASEPDLQKTEETKEIYGYSCTKYIAKTQSQGMQLEQHLWVTNELKTLDYKGDSFKGMLGQGNMNIDMDGFPLLIEIPLPGMPVTMAMEVTEIDFKKISKKLFEKPEGYSEKPFKDMLPTGF